MKKREFLLLFRAKSCKMKVVRGKGNGNLNGDEKMKTFSYDQIEEGMSQNLGFCTECGAEKDSCEPDAREYRCEDCGERAVYGAEELIVMGLVT